MVWDVADEIRAKMSKADKKALRVAVLAECEKRGCNPAMAATQYSRWRNVQDAQQE